MARPSPVLASVAMFIALLPTLLFLGHWSVSLAIPATGVRIELLLGEPPADVGSHEHGRHCHGEASSCSDIPFAGAGGFALLNEFSGRLADGDCQVTSARGEAALAALHAPVPELRPPRALPDRGPHGPSG